MFTAIISRWLIVFLFPIIVTFVNPAHVNAGFFSFLTDYFSGNGSSQTENAVLSSNSQTVPLLQSSINYDLSGARGGGDITIVDNEALMSENGPSGTLADISDTASTGQISKYTVRKGDSLASIAKMFGVSANTIVWANDVNAKTLKEGQTLVILPVSGVMHTVVKGDTLKSIAKKYKADLNEMVQFNGIDQNDQLSVGDSIIIPDGEGTAKVNVSTRSISFHNNPFRGGDGPEYPGYYIRPIVGGVKTQGLHGYNAVDLATPVGTPVMASASGEVIISRSSGWNGGYGRYIVISHYNGTQTLYGHLSDNFVSEGERVVQGQVIGLTGNTGNSTGPHIHFEVRGAKNTF